MEPTGKDEYEIEAMAGLFIFAVFNKDSGEELIKIIPVISEGYEKGIWIARAETYELPAQNVTILLTHHISDKITTLLSKHDTNINNYSRYTWTNRAGEFIQDVSYEKNDKKQIWTISMDVRKR